MKAPRRPVHRPDDVAPVALLAQPAHGRKVGEGAGRRMRGDPAEAGPIGESAFPAEPQSCYTPTARAACGRGEIGRRAGFRFPWACPWGFESPRPHQSPPIFKGFPQGTQDQRGSCSSKSLSLSGSQSVRKEESPSPLLASSDSEEFQVSWRLAINRVKSSGLFMKSGATGTDRRRKRLRSRRQHGDDDATRQHRGLLAAKPITPRSRRWYAGSDLM